MGSETVTALAAMQIRGPQEVPQGELPHSLRGVMADPGCQLRAFKAELSCSWGTGSPPVPKLSSGGQGPATATAGSMAAAPGVKMHRRNTQCVLTVQLFRRLDTSQNKGCRVGVNYTSNKNKR